VSNLQHATDDVHAATAQRGWAAPDVSAWSGRTFQGFVRPDGRVGTRNHWIVVPLVFCENRNVQVMSEALLSELGYGRDNHYRGQTRRLIQSYTEGGESATILETCFDVRPAEARKRRLFANVDGIKFLRHEGGCGGTYEDAVNL
jgi:altronate hydrolase